VLALGSLGRGVRYAFTTRPGGVSSAPYDELNLSLAVGDDPTAVARNRAKLLDRVRLRQAVWLTAAHAAEVAVVDADSGGTSPEVDATVTRATDLGLASLSADCALIVLADSAEGVIATAHCGRPGLVAGVVRASVSAMRACGAKQIRAVVGPAICGWCYEVPAVMADEVAAVVPAAAARSRAGTAALDIAAGVAAQLDVLDVDVVRRVGGCTFEDQRLFSYRRDHVTGRSAALVWRSS
jgi:purine-nucleoside/S-methyl-5'-thioadenosine phosphorylase / adenosine deaminase